MAVPPDPPGGEPRVTISAHGVSRLLAGHPWVYRSDIRAAPRVEPGDTVRVQDERGHFLGKPRYSSASHLHLLVSYCGKHAARDCG